MKYLLIDGNNLAVRCAFANESLKNKEGISTGVHFGVFQSLINLKQTYKDYQFLICWDGKSARRMNESNNAVTKGLIKSAYKANRKKDEQPKPLLDFYEQSPYLKKGIEQTGLPQIRLEEFETDDVLASYCKKLVNDEIMVVTSDSDYFQILDDHVNLFDGMKNKKTTKQDFINENKIEPKQYIDVGALCGDDSDNIHGIPSVGEKTSLELIQQYKSWENLYVEYHKQYGPLRVKYPDLYGDDFKKLESIITKSRKPKYSEITSGMQYSGVALAVEEKKINSIPKSVLMTLMFEERVKLAYSLKKMDDNIPNLPDIVQGKMNKERLLEYFDYYDIESLKDSVIVFE